MARFPFNYEDLPLKHSVDMYAKAGRPVGDFLEAVISNDLRGACSRADDTNIHLIPVYIAYLYNETPCGCWGSKELYKKWLKSKRQKTEE